MIYLSGRLPEKHLGKRLDLGIMVGYRGPGKSLSHRATHLHQVWHAEDNGCYTNPNIVDDEYIGWLESLLPYQKTSLFATARDVVGDYKATWERSEPMLPRIRALGFPAALVAQDGIEDHPIHWDAFDCLFIGGSTDWKLSAEILPLCREALRRGKWLHMGRVNSRRRLLRARYYGCHSADGTMISFGPDKRLPQIAKWLDFINSQPVIVGLHD